VAADVRGAGTDLTSQKAFTFVMLGLHGSTRSGAALGAWLDEACEVYSAVLQPFRHKGESNYLNVSEPGPLFESLAPCPHPEAPLVALTTSGFNLGDSLDMARVREFGTGVMAVRMSMTAVPGLHSQQSFFFPGGLEYDPFTLTFWKNDESIRTFSYGAGVHRYQLDRQRELGLADRTSFTRFNVLRSTGTWYGVDPQACWAH
jgi:hypothetical protein